jgi:hypothetical protein
MQHARVVSAIVAAAVLLAAGSAANAFGALAIDSNRGPAYGFSYDQDSVEAARDAAIENCGPDCSVVVTFEFACAAYAADQSRDDGAYGWGYAPSRDRAQYFAMKFCDEFGGEDCLIRVWACESVRDGRGMGRFEGKPRARP